MKDKKSFHGVAEEFKPKSTAPYGIVIALDDLPGLQAARILYKRNIPVIGIVRNLDNFRCRTRVCERIFKADYDSEEYIDLLICLGPTFSEKAVLFPCSDTSVLLISRRRKELETWYHIALPYRDNVELLMDKAKFYAFAMKEGFSIPKTFMIRNREDAEKAAKQLRFPCLVKPSLKNPLWFEKAKKKVLHVSQGEDLLGVYDRFHDCAEVLIAQELIEGSDATLYSFNGYFDAKSQPLATFIARKIRQYPPHNGVSSLGVEVRNDVVLEESLRLFKHFNYHGLGYLEMKKDALSGKHYIIEPNIGRPTGRSAISEAGGVDMLYTKYCDLVGLPLPENRVQKYDGAKWIHITQDLKSAWYYRRRGELSFKDWLRSIGGRKCYAVFSWFDPLPFIVEVRNMIFSGLRKILR